MKAQAVILGLLAFAFLGWVLGQVTVALLEPDWLPPMQEPIPQPIERRSTC